MKKTRGLLVLPEEDGGADVALSLHRFALSQVVSYLLREHAYHKTGCQRRRTGEDRQRPVYQEAYCRAAGRSSASRGLDPASALPPAPPDVYCTSPSEHINEDQVSEDVTWLGLVSHDRK